MSNMAETAKSSGTNTKVLNRAEALDALKKSTSRNPIKIFAYYSSVLDGIVVPSYGNDDASKDDNLGDLLTVPIDDHMVHRGHSVFDTANIVHGNLYGIDVHLDRLLVSAKRARIVSRWSKEELKKIVSDTAAASNQTEAYIRMWLTAGRGDFSIVPKNCTGSNFYCVVHQDRVVPPPEQRGVKEVIVSVPLKSPSLATFKSTNYLINALCAMEAGDHGSYLGLQLDDQGLIAEFSIGSAGFLGKDLIFRSPKLDKILRSTTLFRSYDFKDELIKKGLIKDFVFCDVTPDMAKSSLEVISFGGGRITPVVMIDDIVFNKGVPGPFYMALNELLEADMKEGPYVDIISSDSNESKRMR